LGSYEDYAASFHEDEGGSMDTLVEIAKDRDGILYHGHGHDLGRASYALVVFHLDLLLQKKEEWVH